MLVTLPTIQNATWPIMMEKYLAIPQALTLYTKIKIKKTREKRKAKVIKFKIQHRTNEQNDKMTRSDRSSF